MASHRRTRNEATENEDVMESFIVMARVIREQAAITTLMAQQMANGHGNGDEYMRFSDFCKANPPSFRGAYDPDAANEWIKEMEKIFSILICTEEQKVSFVAFMLKVDTMFWWNDTRNLLENNGTPIN